MDQAILSIGAVCIPIYAYSTAQEVLYMFKHSGTKVCFAGSEEQANNVLKIKKKAPGLLNIIVFDNPGKSFFGPLQILDSPAGK